MKKILMVLMTPLVFIAVSAKDPGHLKLNKHPLPVSARVNPNLENQVVIFADCYLKGASATLPAGSYRAYQLGIGNDVLSSLHIPTGYTVTIYSDDNFRGRSASFSANVYCLDRDWNDQVSSIVVAANNYNGGYNNNNNNNGGYNNNNNNNGYNNGGYNNNNNYNNGNIDYNKVSVYEECNYRGPSANLEVGRFDVGQFGIRNDVLTSLRVPRGYRVVLFENSGFSGPSIEFRDDKSCITGYWARRTSSIIVERTYDNNNNGNSGINTNSVIMYADSWYRGDKQSFSEGEFPSFNGASLNSNVSSINIPNGFVVTVYDMPKFRGSSYTFSSSILNLSSYKWNDRIQSFRIYRK